LEKVAVTTKFPLNVRVIWFETVGVAEKSTVVWKALAGAALMAREATPSPRAPRALTRLKPPSLANVIGCFG
jgi:hypothetical protein